MSAYEVVVCVVAIGFSTAAVASLPTHWRGEHTFWVEEPPVWWLWGDWAWQGWIRSGPVIVVGLAVSCYALPFGVAFPARSTGQVVAVVFMLGGLGLGFLLAASITLFGRPRTLIPPHLR